MTRFARRSTAVVLTVLLLVSFCVLGSYATGLDNFVKDNTYETGHFVDVSEDVWYAKHIKTAYNAGIMTGITEETFHPNGSLTRAEAATIAARLHSIYHTGTQDFSSYQKDGDKWYTPYVHYLEKNEVFSWADDISFKETITREEFVGLMTNTLPAEEFVEINEIEDKAIPDLYSSEYYDEIYLFYRAGILIGNINGAFMPEQSLNRASAAVIVSRMIEPELRAGLTLKTKYITLYAPDGRTRKTAESEVEAFKAVGWYTEPVTELYALDGRTRIVPTNEAAQWREVDWYTEEEYNILTKVSSLTDEGNYEGAICCLEDGLKQTTDSGTKETFEKKIRRIADIWGSEINAPLAVASYSINLSGSAPKVTIYFRNVGTKTVQSFSVQFGCYNIKGKATVDDADLPNTFTGTMNDISIEALDKAGYYWTLTGNTQTTSVQKLRVISVTFSDGTTWTAD